MRYIPEEPNAFPPPVPPRILTEAESLKLTQMGSPMKGDWPHQELHGPSMVLEDFEPTESVGANPGSGSIPYTQTEYQSAGSEAPLVLMATLFALMLAFGLLLTILIPVGFIGKALSQFNAGEQVLAPIWYGAIAVLSLLVLLRWCTVQTMAFIAQCKLRRTGARTPELWPLVSVLVPAYQEGETITSALHSLVNLDYPRYEIIVVDDGSVDDTFSKASAFAGRHRGCNVEVYRKPNGGKWSALNYGFSLARAELILCIDADSRLSPQALKQLVSRLDHPEIEGVSGQITVRNRRSVITRLQAYEYIVANGGLRTAQSLMGLVLVVPGPIGLYRRVALLKAWANSTPLSEPHQPGYVEGPFSHETFAEDFQLSVTVLALGGRIVYEPRALSYTRSPDSTHSLLNQRYRWFRGTMQVLKIYVRQLRKPAASKNPNLSVLIVAIYLLDLFVLPMVNTALIVSVVVSAITSAPIADLCLWISAVWLLNLMTGTYHILAQRDDLTLLHLVPIYDLYHGLLLNVAWAIALIDEIRKSKMQW